jgi:hypothetical protein
MLLLLGGRELLVVVVVVTVGADARNTVIFTQPPPVSYHVGQGRHTPRVCCWFEKESCWWCWGNGVAEDCMYPGVVCV